MRRSHGCSAGPGRHVNWHECQFAPRHQVVAVALATRATAWKTYGAEPPSSRRRVGSRAGYGELGVAGDVAGQISSGQPHWLVVPGGVEAELVGEVGACGQAALSGGDHVDGGE